MSDEKEISPDEINVRLNFRIPPRMPSVYAHHMLVQSGEFEVVLSFFEITPPIITEKLPESERLKILQEAGVVAECVARITIAKDRFPAFANALQDVMKQDTAPEELEKHADNTSDNSKG